MILRVIIPYWEKEHFEGLINDINRTFGYEFYVEDISNARFDGILIEINSKTSVELTKVQEVKDYIRRNMDDKVSFIDL